MSGIELASAGLEIGKLGAVGIKKLLRGEEELRAGLEAAALLDEEMRRNLNYLRRTNFREMDETKDRKSLIQVVRGLETRNISQLAGRLGTPTPLTSLLDSIPIPGTKITMLRLVRRVAQRTMNTRDGAEAMARAPGHADPMLLRRRLRNLEEDMRELRTYFAEFPGIKRNTVVTPKGNLFRQLWNAISRRNAAPISLPMVERRVRWEAMLERQHKTIAALGIDIARATRNEGPKLTASHAARPQKRLP